MAKTNPVKHQFLGDAMICEINQASRCSAFATWADASDNGSQVLPIMQIRRSPGEYNKGRRYPMRNWQQFRLHPPSAYQIAIWKTWSDATSEIQSPAPAGHALILAVVHQDSDFVGFVYRKACCLRKEESDPANDIYRVARLTDRRNEIGLLAETNRDEQTASLKFFCNVGSSALRDWEAHSG